jgi:hypothetical protein
VNAKLWLLIVQVLNGLINIWKSCRRNARIDAVRSDPGTEWLRKFGGTDQRGKSSSGSEDSGSDNQR